MGGADVQIDDPASLRDHLAMTIQFIEKQITAFRIHVELGELSSVEEALDCATTIDTNSDEAGSRVLHGWRKITRKLLKET